MSAIEKNHIQIKPNNCKGCGVCVAACPKDCIAIGEDINTMGYKYAQFRQNDCVACGMCFYSCPEFGTITVYRPPKPPKKTDD
ncbi:hypothetical protein BVX99_00590 [bacterium F16]|nr:hypothetical protein BVX99_00590 [bacterium F16]